MTIVITGATGQLGSLVIQHLQKHEPASQFFAVARNIEQAADQFGNSGVGVRYGDYNDPESLERAFAGASKLLFVSSPDFDNVNRVVQHANVVKAARDAGVKHIIYTSYAFAETSQLPLALLHLTTEYAIRTSGIPYTFVRNPLYTEVFVNEGLTSAIEQGELITNTRNGGLNTVSRDDLARGIAAVLGTEGHENKTYNFTSDQPWTFDELVDIISGLTGKIVKHRHVSPDEMASRLQEAGLPEGAAVFTAGTYAAIAEGETAKTSTDLTRLIGEVTPLRTIVEENIKQ